MADLDTESSERRTPGSSQSETKIRVFRIISGFYVVLVIFLVLSAAYVSFFGHSQPERGIDRDDKVADIPKYQSAVKPRFIRDKPEELKMYCEGLGFTFHGPGQSGESYSRTGFCSSREDTTALQTYTGDNISLQYPDDWNKTSSVKKQLFATTSLALQRKGDACQIVIGKNGKILQKAFSASREKDSRDLCYQFDNWDAKLDNRPALPASGHYVQLLAVSVPGSNCNLRSADDVVEALSVSVPQTALSRSIDLTLYSTNEGPLSSICVQEFMDMITDGVMTGNTPMSDQIINESSGSLRPVVQIAGTPYMLEGSYEDDSFLVWSGPDSIERVLRQLDIGDHAVSSFWVSGNDLFYESSDGSITRHDLIDGTESRIGYFDGNESYIVIDYHIQNENVYYLVDEEECAMYMGECDASLRRYSLTAQTDERIADHISGRSIEGMLDNTLYISYGFGDAGIGITTLYSVDLTTGTASEVVQGTTDAHKDVPDDADMQMISSIRDSIEQASADTYAYSNEIPIVQGAVQIPSDSSGGNIRFVIP